jgi:hypothetical protein
MVVTQLHPSAATVKLQQVLKGIGGGGGGRMTGETCGSKLLEEEVQGDSLRE